ncbi:MAG: hypothetical protein K2W96_15040 [Gemmataceae bacterium]|nr:hypothetical protein [Gemmataceae bacterium]
MIEWLEVARHILCWIIVAALGLLAARVTAINMGIVAIRWVWRIESPSPLPVLGPLFTILAFLAVPVRSSLTLFLVLLSLVGMVEFATYFHPRLRPLPPLSKEEQEQQDHIEVGS